MSEDKKKDIKKGILAGTGTIAGGLAGAVVENLMGATDVEGRILSEKEDVNAIVEELPESIADDSSKLDTESIIAEAIEVAPTPQQTKPAMQTVEDTLNPVVISTETEEDVILDSEEDVTVEAESFTVEAVSETIEAEESESDDDIMVVSVSPEVIAYEAEEDEDIDAEAITETMLDEGIVVESEDGPDYADIKDQNQGIVSPISSAIDIPDYVNDANIDSFTENV